jgi:hypothetical protein
MYAPEDPTTNLLVSRVANGSNIPDSEVIGFASGDDMDDYILAHKNRTQAGYPEQTHSPFILFFLGK